METAKRVWKIWRLLHLASPISPSRSVPPVLPSNFQPPTSDAINDPHGHCYENENENDDSSCCSSNSKNHSFSYQDSELDISEVDDESEEDRATLEQARTEMYDELKGIITQSSSSARLKIEQTPDFLFATACLSMVSRLNKDFVAVTPQAKARKLVLTGNTPLTRPRTLTM